MKSSVLFFLGHSKSPINNPQDASSCYSTDVESDTEFDCYASMDADDYSKPIDITSRNSNNTQNNNKFFFQADPLITPPAEDDLAATAAAPRKNVSSQSIKSIAKLSQAVYSLPPSPPISPEFAKSAMMGNAAAGTTTAASSSSLPISPYSLLRSTYFDVPMSPKPAPNNDLIPCNLGPISPFQLCSDYCTDDQDVDDLCLSDDDDDDDNQAFTLEDVHTQDEQPSVSPEFLVGHEHEIISHLNLEEDPTVVDKFRPKPLLADPSKPFIPSIPVYETVHELLVACYPTIKEGSQAYFYHLGRLVRNRDKLQALSDSIDCYDQQVRKKRCSEISLSASFESEEKRFRARR